MGRTKTRSEALKSQKAPDIFCGVTAKSIHEADAERLKVFEMAVTDADVYTMTMNPAARLARALAAAAADLRAAGPPPSGVCGGDPARRYVSVLVCPRR